MLKSAQVEAKRVWSSSLAALLGAIWNLTVVWSSIFFARDWRYSRCADGRHRKSVVRGAHPVVSSMFASPSSASLSGYIVMRIVLSPSQRAIPPSRRFPCALFGAMALGLASGTNHRHHCHGPSGRWLRRDHHNMRPITGDMNVPMWVKISGALAISPGHRRLVVIRCVLRPSAVRSARGVSFSVRVSSVILYL